MSLFNAFMSLSGAYDADVRRDEPLSRRTSLRVGGPAALSCCAHSYPALARVLDTLRREGVYILFHLYFSFSLSAVCGQALVISAGQHTRQ